MIAILVIFVLLIALFVWAVVLDLKRRRHRAPLTALDTDSAARRAQEARRDTNSTDGGGWT